MGKLNDEKLSYIIEKLQTLKYGTIEITVHNDEITQVDITEKKRYPLQKKSQKD